MAHNGKAYLREMAAHRPSRVTILRPDYKPDRVHYTPPKLTDYISVPRLTTIGSFPLIDNLNLASVHNLIVAYKSIGGTPK